LEKTKTPRWLALLQGKKTISSSLIGFEFTPPGGGAGGGVPSGAAGAGAGAAGGAAAGAPMSTFTSVPVLPESLRMKNTQASSRRTTTTTMATIAPLPPPPPFDAGCGGGLF
jgi:hypothetical protein